MRCRKLHSGTTHHPIAVLFTHSCTLLRSSLRRTVRKSYAGTLFPIVESTHSSCTFLGDAVRNTKLLVSPAPPPTHSSITPHVSGERSSDHTLTHACRALVIAITHMYNFVLVFSHVLIVCGSHSHSHYSPSRLPYPCNCDHTLTRITRPLACPTLVIVIIQLYNLDAVAYESVIVGLFSMFTGK
jgi:hypothetical protein